MVLTIIKNKRGRFDGLDTKDKKAAADALSLKTDSVAVWVFDDDSLAIMTKMHQTLATKEVDVTLQTLRGTPEEHKVVLSKPPRSLLAIIPGLLGGSFEIGEGQTVAIAKEVTFNDSGNPLIAVTTTTEAGEVIKAEDMVDWLKTFPLTADAFVDDAEVAAADIELGDTATRVAFNVAKISSAANRNLVDALTCAQVLRSLGMRPAAETADALAPWLSKVEAALASPAGVKNMRLVMWKIDQSPPFVALPDEEDTPEQKAKWLDTHLEITRIHKELVLKASGRKEVVLPDERQRRGGRKQKRRRAEESDDESSSDDESAESDLSEDGSQIGTSFGV